MISRKVQKTGGGTYTISLPKKWAKERVKKGDSLFLFEGENELIIRTKKPKNEKRRIEIEFKKGVPSLMKRIIAAYLEGYERIVVHSEGRLQKREKIKREVRKNLAGIEIISESKESIVIKSLVSFEKISFENSLSKLYFLVESMLEDLISYLEKGEEIKKKLESMEEEVDRFFIFAFKQLRSYLRGTKVKTNIKDKGETLHYILITKSLEKIADHICILHSEIKQRQFSTAEKDALTHLLTEGYHVFRESYKPLIEKDFQMGSKKASEALKTLEEIRDNENLPEMMEEMFLIYHIVRILGYSSDIAEMAVDISIP